MLTNLHTHTTFCDGKNTPEEFVKSAIEKGFSSIGFSGHGYTPFDLSYCVKDIEGYIKEINRLKEVYKKDIQIYLGLEEDAFAQNNRNSFDYIIGASHYFEVGGKYYPVDLDAETLKACLKLYDNSPIDMARAYYEKYCEYIRNRKPDIIAHFDLITKFEEDGDSIFLSDRKYLEITEQYVKEALKSDCIFEVNTGAIARGLRTTPYPAENILRVIKEGGGKVTISSDSHSADAIDCKFDDVKKMLRDIGFLYVYVMNNGEFVKDYL